MSRFQAFLVLALVVALLLSGGCSPRRAVVHQSEELICGHPARFSYFPLGVQVKAMPALIRSAKQNLWETEAQPTFDGRYFLSQEPGSRFPQLIRRDANDRLTTLIDFGIHLDPQSALGRIAFSPFGERIAFTEERPDSSAARIHFLGMSRDMPTHINHLLWHPRENRLYATLAEEGVASTLAEISSQGVRKLLTISNQGHSLSIKLSFDEQWLIVREHSLESTKLFAVSVNDHSVREFPTKPGARYDADIAGRELYLLTNESAPDYELRVRGLFRAQSERLLAGEERQTPIREFFLIPTGILILRQEITEKRLFYLPYSGAGPAEIQVPPGYVIERVQRATGETAIEAVISSPTTPPRRCRIDLSHTALVDCPVEPSPVSRRRRWAKSTGGHEVPTTLLIPPIAPKAVLTRVYGAYGEIQDGRYARLDAELLRRGFIIALIHTRGGGELGDAWWAAGRGRNKEHGISDFENALRDLKSVPETKGLPRFGAARSAGALILLSTWLRSPELLTAAWVESPYVGRDKNAGSQLDIREREEFADFHLVPKQDFTRLLPPLLLRVACNDEAVSTRDALDFFRAVKAGGAKAQLVLHVSEDGFHGGEKALDEQINYEAEAIAWLESLTAPGERAPHHRYAP